jgi:adenosylcobinamide kinase/adenosylcobinamide-phosphate guanylyltransferase
MANSPSQSRQDPVGRPQHVEAASGPRIGSKIALITGGCRSGKSAYAQELAERISPSRLYVATCPVTDDEIGRRIEAHRQARRDRGWETVETELDLAGVLRRHAGQGVVLIDCVTLWVNNRLYHADREGCGLDESAIAGDCREMLEAAKCRRGSTVLVTNEVGLGIVPENAQARRYRDLVGRANQVIAAAADTVTLMVCGIPFCLKKADHA